MMPMIYPGASQLTVWLGTTKNYILYKYGDRPFHENSGDPSSDSKYGVEDLDEQ
jgi:hypothetical protein